MSWLDPFNVIGTVTDTIFPNPSDEAMGYLDQMGPMYNKAYKKYINWGDKQMPVLEQQYGQLLNNPASVQAMLGQGFTQDPGYQYQLQEAMNAGNQAASAGGMLGTPGHQRQMMGVAQGLANQGYNDYWNRNQGLYGQGLSGTQGMFNTGYESQQSLANAMGNMYGAQAGLGYAGQAQQNQMMGALMGAISAALSKGGGGM